MLPARIRQGIAGRDQEEKTMLNSAEKTGTNEFTVDFTIPAEDFNAAVMKAYHKAKNKINVPGFRKGKAPKAIIEKMYGENVFYDDALEIAFPDAYDKALEEAGVKGVDNPFDFDIREVGKDGAHIICKVTVKPEIEIDGYKGLSAVKEPVEVTDEEVGADLERKRDENAREITVEDRAAENGDIANIDFEGFVDGAAFEGGKGEDHDLELGSGSFIPGFEEQIVGHSVGDEFDVNVTFPEEYAEELAGKDAVFKVKLNEIKIKELPELDDEFAKDISEFDTLDELKADIRKTIAERKQSAADREFETAIFDKLAGLVTAEIPQCMIDRTIDNMVSEMRYNIEAQGIPFDQYLSYLGMTEESVRETYRDRAEKEVKTELALEKIAVLEGVEVTAEDVEAEYAAMAKRYGVDADTVRKAIAEERVTEELKNRKASDIVKENAVAEAPAKEEKAEEKPRKKAPAKKKAPARKKAEAEEAPAEEAPAEEAAPAEEPKADEPAE